MPPYYNGTTGTDQIWNLWVTVQGTGTTSTYYPTYRDTAWAAWTAITNNATTINQYTYQDQAWDSWIRQTYSQTPYQETPEQRANWERIAKEAEVHRRAERERRTAARARARTLLDSVLTAEQKAELDRHGRFHVRGGQTGRRYCIRAEGQSGNVDLLNEDGSVQATFCAHPSYTHDRPGELVPEGDAWLAQMMEIELDEFNFLRTTNVPRGSIPRELIQASGRGALVVAGNH
jgi:hypothetical protein